MLSSRRGFLQFRRGMNIDAILTPAELPALARRDLSNTACVVFDILRATSTFVTALHHGAKGIIPAAEIPAVFLPGVIGKVVRSWAQPNSELKID